MQPTGIHLCRLEKRRVEDAESLRAADLVLCARPGNWLLRKIQDAAWWLCVRLGADFYRPFTRDVYHRIRVDADSLLHKARLNSRDIRHLWDQDGKYLIVGAKTAHDLWGECADQSFMQFAVSSRFGMDGETKVLGLQVVIVPWIEEGLFVLPELKVQVPA